MSRGRETLTDEQRRMVIRLKSEKLSGRVVQEKCAAGVGDLPGFTVSIAHVNRTWAAFERETQSMTISDLAKRPPRVALAHLVARAITIAERDLDAHAKAQAMKQLDGAAFRRTCAALKELEGMSRRLPSEDAPSPTADDQDGDEKDEPRDFADELLSDNEPDEREDFEPDSGASEAVPDPLGPAAPPSETETRAPDLAQEIREAAAQRAAPTDARTNGSGDGDRPEASPLAEQASSQAAGQQDRSGPAETRKDPDLPDVVKAALAARGTPPSPPQT